MAVHDDAIGTGRLKSCASTSTALSTHFAALPQALAKIRTGQHTIVITFRTHEGAKLAGTPPQQPGFIDGDDLPCEPNWDLLAVLVSVAVVP